MKELSFSDRFVQHLGVVLGAPGRPRAILRRSLAFPPGQMTAAFPYIEPLLVNADDWTRQSAYLVAGIYAASGVPKGVGNMGAAAARLLLRTGSKSVEARFLALLDSDEEQLPHRLRQMNALMSGSDIAPDWAELFYDLRNWQKPNRRTQVRWARDFYKHDAAQGGQDFVDDSAAGAQDGKIGQNSDTQQN